MHFASRRQMRGLALWIIASHVLSLTPFAFAGPEGGSVVAGSATISSGAGLTTITQTTDKAIVNWQGFSTAAGEAVHFAQPGASSVTLNRVTGSAHSQLDGSLTANGRVFLLNPNGIVFGRTSQVNVGGLVASTLSMTDADFMAGRHKLQQEAGRSLGAVVNKGSITTTQGGRVALVAPVVSNEGTIHAPGGAAALAAGTRAEVSLDGVGLVTLSVDPAAGRRNVNAPADAADVISSVVNNRNLVSAGSVSVQDGVVVLGAAEGVAANSGTLSASSATGTAGHASVDSTQLSLVHGNGRVEARGTGAGARGGKVHVLGDDRVGVIETARLDASGRAGGGQALVGGARVGTPGKLARAALVTRDVAVHADAIDEGNGGEIIVRADQVTKAHGALSARGGAASGDGGFIETSGAKLEVHGSIDLAAPAGTGGNWLIDPNDIQIVNGAGLTNASQGGTPPCITFCTTNDSAVIGIDNIKSALQGGTRTVTVLTGTAGCNSQAGNITFAATFDFDGIGTGDTLRLIAANNIVMNGAISDSVAGCDNLALCLQAGGAIQLNSNWNLDGGNICVTAGTTITQQTGTTITSTGNISLTASGLICVDTIVANSSALSIVGGSVKLNNLSQGTCTTIVATAGDIIDATPACSSGLAATLGGVILNASGRIGDLSGTGRFEVDDAASINITAGNGARLANFTLLNNLVVSGTIAGGDLDLTHSGGGLPNNDLIISSSNLIMSGGGNVVLKAACFGAEIVLNGNISTAGTVFLCAANGGGIVGGCGTVQGSAVSMRTFGAIGFGSVVRTDTQSLNICANQVNGPAINVQNFCVLNSLSITTNAETANILSIKNGGGGDFLRNTGGGVLAGSGIGNLVFTDTALVNNTFTFDNLSVGSINWSNVGPLVIAGCGLTATSGAVTLQTAGASNIAVNADLVLQAPAATATLTAGGAITAGPLGQLTLCNATANLTAGTSVGATGIGALIVAGSGNTINATSGVGAGSGSIFLTSPQSFTPGAINADCGAGNIELLSIAGAINGSCTQLIRGNSLVVCASTFVGSTCGSQKLRTNVNSLGGLARQSSFISEANAVTVNGLAIVCGAPCATLDVTVGGALQLCAISGPNLAITAGSVTDADGDVDVVATGNVAFTLTGTGGIGNGNALDVDAPILTVNAGGLAGNVNLDSLRPTGFNDVTIANVNGNVTVNALGACGNIATTGIGATGTVNLAATRFIDDGDALDDTDIAATNVVLTAGLGIGVNGPAGPLDIAAASISASGGCGNVNLINTSANLALSAVANGAVSVFTSGNMAIASLSGGACGVTAQAGGDITRTGCGTVNTPGTASLVAGGNVGASGATLALTVGQLCASGGNIFVSLGGLTNVGLLNAGCGTGSVQIANTGGLASAGPLNVRAASTQISTNGNVQLVLSGGTISATKTGAGGTVDLTSQTNANFCVCAPTNTVVLNMSCASSTMGLAAVIGGSVTLNAGQTVSDLNGASNANVAAATLAVTFSNGTSNNLCLDTSAPCISISSIASTGGSIALRGSAVNTNLNSVTGNTNVSVTTSGDLGVGALSGTTVTLNAGANDISDLNSTCVNVNAAACATVIAGTSANLDIAAGALFLTGTQSGGCYNIRELDSITAQISIQSCSLATLTAGGSITTNGVSGGNLALNAGGSILQGAGLLNPFTASLTAGGDIGNTATPIQLQATQLAASSCGQIHISSVGTGSLALVSATASSCSSIAAAGSVALGSVSSSTRFDLVVGGNITDANGVSTNVCANFSTLQAQNIGTASDRLDVIVGNLLATSTAGELNIQQGASSISELHAATNLDFFALQSLQLQNSTAGDVAHIEVDNASLTGRGIGTNLAAPVVNLVTREPPPCVVIGLCLTGRDIALSIASPSVSLSSAGNVQATFVGATTVNFAEGTSVALVGNSTVNLGTVIAATTAVVSTPGAILDANALSTNVTAASASLFGASVGTAADPIDTAATLINASASSGGVFVNEADTATIGFVSANGAVSVKSGGDLSFHHVTSSTQGITLESTGGSLFGIPEPPCSCPGVNIDSAKGVTLLSAGIVGTAACPITVDIDSGRLSVGARGASGGVSAAFTGTAPSTQVLALGAVPGAILFNGVASQQRVSSVLRLALLDPEAAVALFGSLGQLAVQAIQNKDRVLARSLLRQSPGLFGGAAVAQGAALTPQETAELNSIFGAPPAPPPAPAPVVVTPPPPAPAPVLVSAPTPAPTPFLGGTAPIGLGGFTGFGGLLPGGTSLGGTAFGGFGGLSSGTGFAGAAAVLGTGAGLVGTSSVAAPSFSSSSLFAGSVGGFPGLDGASLGGTSFGGTAFGGTSFGRFGGLGFGLGGTGFAGLSGLGGTGFGGFSLVGLGSLSGFGGLSGGTGFAGAGLGSFAGFSGGTSLGGTGFSGGTGLAGAGGFPGLGGTGFSTLGGLGGTGVTGFAGAGSLGGGTAAFLGGTPTFGLNP